MKLTQFLENKNLTAVELLPDNRLINVVIDSGILFGVQVDDIPSNVAVIRKSVDSIVNNIITVDDLQFNTDDYDMLGAEEPTL